MKFTNDTPFLSAFSRCAIIAFTVACLFGFGTPAKANLIQNGSFEQTSNLSSPGGNFCATGSTCVSNVTDWTSVCNVACGPGTSTILTVAFPGTNGSAFNNGVGLNGTVPNSPDGGNFIEGDGDPRYSASFSQSVSGLTVGASYVLTFYQAAAQEAGFTGPTTEQWQVTFGGSTQTSTLMSDPSQGVQPWTLQTLSFTATSATETLTFLALGTPTGAPPVSLLDGVSLNPAATPEVSTAFLMLGAMGLVGLCALYRQKKARA